jgi:hypothetical protein
VLSLGLRVRRSWVGETFHHFRDFVRGSLLLNKVLLTTIRLMDNTVKSEKGKLESKRDKNNYLIIIYNKWIAVPWALRLQRVVLQGSFASWALLYFKVKLSTLGPLLQGLGAIIKGLFSGRALRLRVSLFN